MGAPNLMGYIAAEAAYAEGQPWLSALLGYPETNRTVMAAYLAEHMPRLRMTTPEGTYLAWIDCREAGRAHLRSLSSSRRGAWRSMAAPPSVQAETGLSA